MISLLQRVNQASVTVDGQVVGAIERGLVAMIAIVPEDTFSQAERLVERILGYRVFPDAAGRMNQSLVEHQGGLLLIPQFTLAADTRKGTRPSFTRAAAPEHGERLYTALVEHARAVHPRVASGIFGADMQVALVNDGPVTFWLEAKPHPPTSDWK